MVFSAPISTTKEKMCELLGRDWPIGGDPLTEDELLKLREDLLYDIQVGWDPSLSFFVEGMNLPEDHGTC